MPEAEVTAGSRTSQRSDFQTDDYAEFVIMGVNSSQT
jgi:hypothetical protein